MAPLCSRDNYSSVLFLKAEGIYGGVSKIFIIQSYQISLPKNVDTDF